MTKKIAIFQPHIGAGGLTHVMLSLAAGMADKGLSVELIVLDVEIAQELKSKIPTNVQVVKVNAGRTLTAIFPLALYLIKNKPDVLISGGPSSNCIALIAKYFTKDSCRQIITEHSLPSVDVFDTEKIIDRGMPFLMKRLYLKADNIIAVSNVVANDLSNFTNIRRNKVDVVYNPVVTLKMLSLGDEAVSHQWLSNPQFKTLLFVGRLESVKNLQLALHAFALKRHESAKFIIIGDGTQRPYLESLADELLLTEHVDFMGYSPNPYPYMKLSDALVLCSKWEGLPTVLIEAMAFGTQVVATNNLDGAKEILNYGEVGFIVENNNPEKLSLGITKAINNQEQSDNLKQRALKFNLENSLQEYLKLF